MSNSTATMGNRWWFLKRLKQDYHMILWSHFWYVCKTPREMCTPMTTAGTIHNSQELKSTHTSINGWMDNKMWDIHTRAYYSALKMKAICHLLQGWTLRTLCSIKQASCKNSNTSWFHARVVTFIELGNRRVIARAGEGKEDGTCLICTVVQMHKISVVLEISLTILWIYLKPS